MRYVFALIVSLLLVSSEASAKQKWFAQMPSYAIEVSGPLEEIPTGLNMNSPGAIQTVASRMFGGGLSAEDCYAIFASAGYRLFQGIRDSQDNYYWYRIELWPKDRSSSYDGLLGQLSLYVDSEKVITPLVILTTPVSQKMTMENAGAQAPVITLFAQGRPALPVVYSDFPSESGGRQKYIAFMKVPRTFDPGSVTSVTFPGMDAQ